MAHRSTVRRRRLVCQMRYISLAILIVALLVVHGLLGSVFIHAPLQNGSVLCGTSERSLGDRAKRRSLARRPWKISRRFFFNWADDASAQVSEELQGILAEGGDVDKTYVNGLIDELIAAKVPFNVNYFGGGLWRAIYTKGKQPKWERNAKLLPFVKNIAGQDYDPSALAVINYGEVLGPAMHFTAEGRFEEVDKTVTRCPKDYDVFVESGGITAFGLRIPLPIKGKGYLRCLYADEGCRIFVSPEESPDKWEEEGLIVVQMPMSKLDPAWRPPYATQRST
eukprot:TRINITY_DN82887_c0_g1_i1.p1 TRINITY_DN82887_c0_g1~~TRINITY_DN82887_c0_g1_i1.p1  ORF type:complete len:281 (-),score=39.25 TRINITY_DN82887_c0_g1_i1:213-1055(-)